MDAVQPGTGATADSPTAPAPDYASFEREADARDLGRVSPPAASVEPAASPTATPAEQAASTEALPSAASEPAKPADKAPRNLQTRHRQVDADLADLKQKLEMRKALRAELDAISAPANPKPASEPARPADWQRYASHPNAPKEEDFANYRDFVIASATFAADRQHEERTTRDRLDAESRARMADTEQAFTGFTDRLKLAREGDAEFDRKVDPGLLPIVPTSALPPGQPIRPQNAIMQAVVESEVGPALLVHFSTPEGREDWTKLTNVPTPAAMLRMFGRIEARIEGQAVKPAGDPPPVNSVTSAPAPPLVLGTKPPASPDRARAAAEAGDYGAYEAAANARDLAVARR